MGKVLHWELCQEFKLVCTNKLYMHNQASVLKNEMHQLLWDFEIQTDRQISARRPELVIINKKKRTCRIDHRVKSKEIEKKDKYLDLARELNKTVEHESDCDTNCNRSSCYSDWRIGARTGGFGNKRTRGDHPDYSIFEIVQNTEKSTGDLSRLVVTQTPVRNHRLTLVWKTLKGIKLW